MVVVLSYRSQGRSIILLDEAGSFPRMAMESRVQEVGMITRKDPGLLSKMDLQLLVLCVKTFPSKIQVINYG